METYLIFKDLAIIILYAELCGLLARTVKVPQVVGQILAGLIIGPSVLNLVHESEMISYMSEIGVMLIMFSAGLTTNLKELLHTGLISLAVACAGVFVPLLGGFLLFSFYYYGGIPETGSIEFFKALFIGTIMTATSVGITVQVLKELGKLQTRVGQVILSAAIIDDVIGIIVLTFVITLSGAGGAASGGIGQVCLKVLLFFAFVIVLGVIFYNVFKVLDMKYEHHRRMPILGLALAMLMAYSAERFFGIADITGAYAAGIILCNLKDSKYFTEKIDVSSYMFFAPIFFFGIGLKTDLNSIDSSIITFSLLFIAVALITKVIACGAVGKLAKFSLKDSLKIGVGMMTRGEVALIVASKGLSSGLVEQKFFTSVILLIICSSIATPIFLKLLFKNDSEEQSEDHQVPAQTAAN